MNTQTPILTKTNQHYQLTVPLQIRRKIPVAKGEWFIVQTVGKDILFRSVNLNSQIERQVDYANSLNKEEISSIEQSLKELKNGKYTTMSRPTELKRHFAKTGNAPAVLRVLKKARGILPVNLDGTQYEKKVRKTISLDWSNKYRKSIL